MRDSYNIRRIKLQAGFTKGGSYHEIKVWFEGMKDDEMPATKNIPVYLLKDKGIIKKGYSFKKSREFYNSEEGLKWVSDYLKSKDEKEIKDELLSDLKWRLLPELAIQELIKTIDFTKELIKNRDIK